MLRVPEGEKLVQVCAILSNVYLALENQINVTLATSDGSATAGSDFVSTSLDTFFPVGSENDTQVCLKLNVTITDDTFTLENKEFFVTLAVTSSSDFVFPVNNVTTITVVDNEG